MAGAVDERKVGPKTPVTRDVVATEHALDDALTSQDVSLYGVCPTREEIYRVCFEDVIHQVRVSCEERGALLELVKDEFVKTRTKYRDLYTSATSLGLRQRLRNQNQRP